jgi:hypothetical protein
LNGDSVANSIKDKSAAQGTPAPFGVRHFAMQRFLLRLAKAHQPDELILKGGMVFQLRKDSRLPFRVTNDLDICLASELSEEEVLGLLKAAADIDLQDGTSSEIKNIERLLGTENGTLRAKVWSKVGRSVMKYDVDIACDLIAAEFLEAYTFDSGHKAIPGGTVLMPTSEAIAAEKISLIIKVAMTYSRAKHYDDLWLLAQKPDFDFAAFGKALRIVLLKQSLAIPTPTGPVPAGLSAEIAATKQADWLEHVQCREAPRNNLVPDDFVEVVDAVKLFAYRGLK